MTDLGRLLLRNKNDSTNGKLYLILRKKKESTLDNFFNIYVKNHYVFKMWELLC
jgi:hypothetical protein